MWLRMLPFCAWSSSSLTRVDLFRPTCTVAWPLAFQPFDQSRDLRRAPGAVGALHHNEFPGQFGKVHARHALAVKPPRPCLGHDDARHGVSEQGWPKRSSWFGWVVVTCTYCPGPTWRQSDRARCFAALQSAGWRPCTRNLKSVLMARYCSRIRPWKMRKLSYGSLDSRKSIPASKYFNCGRPTKDALQRNFQRGLEKNTRSGMAAKS